MDVGQNIAEMAFTPADYVRFRQRLNENLDGLKQVFADPSFGKGAPSFGAELELYIINSDTAPAAINTEIHDQLQDPLLTLELNRFNLEYNFSPVSHSSQPFSAIQGQMDDAMARISKVANKHKARVLPIGILPTLTSSDLGMHAITDVPRYHILAKALRERRGADFHVQIEGADKLDVHWSDISLEGANTSFQFHYRVEPENFANAFNAAQVATPLVLALAANSPMFLGHQLWQETRIALFKQSIDYRMEDSLDRHLPARVIYGLGWVRGNAYELFAEGVYLFEPLLPILSENNCAEQLAQGKAPTLDELRLHHGSIWRWNRPIYDPTNDGHLRIELRTLPAGPSHANMVANAALISGMIRGLRDDLSAMLPGLPFRYAEQNFYRAARYGLQAKLFWPNLKSGILEERPVTELLQWMLPVAEEGLSLLGVDEADAGKYLQVAKDGLSANTNGAQWQCRMLKQYLEQADPQTALKAMTEKYYQNYQSGKPVHDWSEKI